MVNQIQTGADALNALNEDDGNDMEFTSFRSGAEFTVKVLGPEDLIQFYAYGIYSKDSTKRINSFVAKNPSKKSKNGYPTENLTSWDLAWKYHKDLSEDWQDDHGKEAYKYLAKERYAFGFIDLDTGEPIIIDFSKKQAQAINAVINKEKHKLSRLTFKLAKQGVNRDTVVSLTPYVDVEMVDKLRQAEIEVEEDLTEGQRKHFDNAPTEFDMSLFDGILYEMDDDEMLEKLVHAGFDVKLIGLEPPENKEDETDEPEEEDEDFDF